MAVPLVTRIEATSFPQYLADGQHKTGALNVIFSPCVPQHHDRHAKQHGLAVDTWSYLRNDTEPEQEKKKFSGGSDGDSNASESIKSIE